MVRNIESCVLLLIIIFCSLIWNDFYNDNLGIYLADLLVIRYHLVMQILPFILFTHGHLSLLTFFGRVSVNVLLP